MRLQFVSRLTIGYNRADIRTPTAGEVAEWSKAALC